MHKNIQLIIKHLKKWYNSVYNNFSALIKKYKYQKISIVVIPNKTNKTFSLNFNKINIYFIVLFSLIISTTYVIYVINKNFLADEISYLQEEKQIAFYEKKLFIEKVNQIQNYYNELKKDINNLYKKTHISNVNNDYKNLFSSNDVLLRKAQHQLQEESDAIIKNIDRYLSDSNFVFSINYVTEKELNDFTENYQYKNFQYSDDNIQYALISAQSKEIADSIKVIKQFLRLHNNVFEYMPFYWPSRGRLSSHFGWRIDPFYRTREFHAGLDIANVEGTRIYSPANGIITKANYSSGYGLNIVIKHKFDYETVYAHLNRMYVRVGQEVKRGQLIGTIGSTGRVTGPHLHYEIKIDGVSIDPRSYLKFK